MKTFTSSVLSFVLIIVFYITASAQTNDVYLVINKIDGKIISKAENGEVTMNFDIAGFSTKQQLDEFVTKFKTMRGVISITVAQDAADSKWNATAVFYKYANKKYGNGHCIFKQCDITDMKELKEGMFDACVSFETIEHIEQPIVFLKNISRVLKNEGILIVSTPNKWGLTKDHKFDYDYELLRDHLERYFHIEDIYVQNSGCMELWVNRGAPRRLVKAMPENIEKAECFIAVCKKK